MFWQGLSKCADKGQAHPQCPILQNSTSIGLSSSSMTILNCQKCHSQHDEIFLLESIVKGNGDAQAPTVPKKILARCGMLACFKLLVKGTIIFRKRHKFKKADQNTVNHMP